MLRHHWDDDRRVLGTLAPDDARSGLWLGGEVQIDGADFGGHVRSGNTRCEEKRPTAKTAKARKQCVLVMVQPAGSTVTAIVESENQEDVLAVTKKHLLPDAVVTADEHAAYHALHARYTMHRPNHRCAYSDNSISTNHAESFFSRMCRGEIGHYHRISGRLLHRYAAEMAFRSDRRRNDNGTIFTELAEMALAHPVSREWKGYWQKRGKG